MSLQLQRLNPLDAQWLAESVNAAAEPDLALIAARHSLQFAADRYPLCLVGAAMAAGGLLAWNRPWHWWWRPTVYARLQPRLLASLLVETMLASLMAAHTSQRKVETP